MRITTWSPGCGCSILLDFENNESGEPLEATEVQTTKRCEIHADISDINDLYATLVAYNLAHQNG